MTKAILTWLGWWVLAILFAPVAIAARADPALPLPVCIARDHGETPAAMMATPAAFDCHTPQREFGQGDFWVRVTALPAGAGTTRTHVRSGVQWMDQLTLYARYADGHVVVRVLSGPALARRIRWGAVVEQVLPDRHVPVTDLLWRVRRSGNFRRILGDIQIVTPRASEDATITNGILFTGFAGLCVALVVFNLALWVALRQRFQLAYCAMVTSLAAFATAFSGALAQLWPTLPNNMRIGCSIVLLPVSTAAALWFALAFMRPHMPSWLDRMLRSLIAALLVGVTAFVILAPWQMRAIDELIGLVYVAVLAMTVPLVMVARRRGGAFAIIFMLAWSAPFMLAVMRVANTFRILPVDLSMQNMLMMVMTVEALLSSLAIVYRVHLLGRERDEARAQEIAARLLADTDPLTGLLNRRAFLAQAIGRPGAQTLLLADLDHFKSVNETIGHDGGDEVLRAFARSLWQVVPADALIARMGGEEFAIVVDAAHAMPPTLILDTIRGVRMPYDLIVTTSIGTCTGPLLREADWNRLYRDADRALYAAKAAGRDRVRDATSLTLAA